MSVSFANLKINRIIVHEVLLASELDGGWEPVHSNLLMELDPKGEGLICKRIIDSLGSESHSVDLDVDLDSEGSAFDQITKLLDADNGDFLRLSQDLALRLTKAQVAGTIKAGIAVILDGSVGRQANRRRFAAVLKAESDAGFVKVVTERAVLLRYISETVLGAQQRLYKIGCVIEVKRPESLVKDEVRSKKDFHVIVYDHQMSNTGNNNAARYFYGTFLGCRLAENASRQTRLFYEETSRHINEMKIPARRRVEFKNHLVSYLRSEEKHVSSRIFAERYLPKELHDSYLKRLRSAGFPPRNVTKDITNIKRKLQIRRMIFSSKVRITAPEENFEELVKFEGYDDGWSTVRISGDLQTQA